MKLDVRSEQLHDQRDNRRAGDEIDHRLLFQSAWSLIEVIVFRPVEYGRLLKKGMRDPVARLEQSPHHFPIERLFNHEEAILIKRSTLLWGELNEFHGCPFSPKSTRLRFDDCSGNHVARRKAMQYFFQQSARWSNLEKISSA